MRHIDRRSDRKYRTARRAFLLDNPWCVDCLAEGRHVPADELDHNIPVVQAPDRFWDRTNWRGRCRAHHEIKTALENKHRRVIGRQQRAWKHRLRKVRKPT